MKTINHQALFKAKGRFHHEGSKDTKKSFNHQALIKPEAENISHGDHGADTEEHGELKLKNVTNFRLRLPRCLNWFTRNRSKTGFTTESPKYNLKRPKEGEAIPDYQLLSTYPILNPRMTPPKGLLRRKNTNYLKAKGRKI